MGEAMRDVVVFGAGKIGVMIADFLHKTSDYALTVVDSMQRQLSGSPPKGLRALSRMSKTRKSAAIVSTARTSQLVLCPTSSTPVSAKPPAIAASTISTSPKTSPRRERSALWPMAPTAPSYRNAGCTPGSFQLLRSRTCSDMIDNGSVLVGDATMSISCTTTPRRNELKGTMRSPGAPVDSNCRPVPRQRFREAMDQKGTRPASTSRPASMGAYELRRRPRRCRALKSAGNT